MANTDLALQLTAKQIGPAQGPANGGLNAFRTRAKVFYLQSADITGIEPGLTYDDTIIKLKMVPKRVRVYESPSDFQAAQALSQGATASIYFQSKYEAVTATSGTATALDATKYIHEVNAGNGGGVSLPDPFLRKVLVVFNTTTGSITVKAVGTTAPIDGSTASVTILAGKRKHFYAPVIPTTAGTTAGWQTAL